jgi:hypothetical protein
MLPGGPLPQAGSTTPVEDEGAGAARERVRDHLAEEGAVGQPVQVDPSVPQRRAQYVEVAGERQCADVVEQIAVAGPALPREPADSRPTRLRSGVCGVIRRASRGWRR